MSRQFRVSCFPNFMRKDPTVPPRVSGPTRFNMIIKCQRMTLLSNSRNKSTNAVVNVKWWGEEESVTLHPININSSRKSSGVTSYSWPVKCLRKQLSDYLSDMGNLNISVLEGDTSIGIVKVPLASLTRDPIRPINSFYPILPLEVETLTDNVRKLPSKIKKLGELHVVLELKPVSHNPELKEKSKVEMNSLSFSDSISTQTPKKKKNIPKVGNIWIYNFSTIKKIRPVKKIV